MKLVRRLALVPVLLLSQFALPAAEADQLPEGAVQNPVVRAYFRKVALESRAYVLPDGRRVYRRDYFLEDRVDRLVRSFLIELIQQRRRLGDAAEFSSQARQRAFRAAGNAEARQVFVASLGQLEQRAGKLRSLLKPVLADFPSKSDFVARVQGDFGATGFEPELQFLLQQSDQVQDLIEGFFFEPSYTVDVESLRGGNMLIRLHEIEKMSQALARRLR